MAMLLLLFVWFSLVWVSCHVLGKDDGLFSLLLRLPGLLFTARADIITIKHAFSDSGHCPWHTGWRDAHVASQNEYSSPH